ncbi:MAG: hypothetical protein K9L25_12545 [Methylovulum sp.]|nr:hypothetical protein [Methylovulum sp.]MCF8007498.1 hypothetical protein [Methylovulum sp.]
MIIYHGTNADISEFNIKNDGGVGVGSGLGAFFTDNPNYADEYASTKTGGNVIPTFLSLKNPLTVNVYDRKY